MIDDDTASTLDVFYLTFNAGKNHISCPVFGNHLFNAFHEKATTLPDMVVFSLQEMAPISLAFIGGYFLDQYFTHYESALNIAAKRFVAEEVQLHRPKDNPYTLVQTCNVGMTGIMLFARDTGSLTNLKTAEVGFGAGDMANKGAVGLRMMYKQTELTFVSTHLAAMEWNLDRRNQNWASIAGGLLFSDPKKIMQKDSDRRAEASSDSTTQPLVFHPTTEKALHDVSIYKPGSHLFVAGDLNYRLSKTSPPIGSIFPSVDSSSDNYYPQFLSRDQLAIEMKAGRTLHGFSEAKIEFLPTYKIKHLPPDHHESTLERIAAEEGDGEDVRWEWAKHRWPGWCDRVLYMDIPDWVSEKGTPGKEMKVIAYDCLPVVRSSDHRAVFLRVQVPLLTPEELTPSDEVVEEILRDCQECEGKMIDPRIKAPVGIAVDSWEHRAAVKKWEYMIGWSMMFSQSKQGLLIFSTLFSIGVITWLAQSWGAQ